MFSAVVKGPDANAASVVARAHGFRTVRVHATLEKDSVTLILVGSPVPARATDNAHMAAWYAEDLGRDAPFPSGTLLYYRELGPDETARERNLEGYDEARTATDTFNSAARLGEDRG